MGPLHRGLRTRHGATLLRTHVDHVFDKQVVDSLTVKIILPEGARNIQVDSPYEISRAPDELYYTYLDTFGHPVIVAHKKNLVEQHIQDIVVHYTFSKVLMLQEPLLLVAAFSILFFTVVIYVRLDLSIISLIRNEDSTVVCHDIMEIQKTSNSQSNLEHKRSCQWGEPLTSSQGSPRASAHPARHLPLGGFRLVPL